MKLNIISFEFFLQLIHDVHINLAEMNGDVDNDNDNDNYFIDSINSIMTMTFGTVLQKIRLFMFIVLFLPIDFIFLNSIHDQFKYW